MARCILTDQTWEPFRCTALMTGAGGGHAASGITGPAPPRAHGIQRPTCATAPWWGSTGHQRHHRPQAAACSPQRRHSPARVRHDSRRGVATTQSHPCAYSHGSVRAQQCRGARERARRRMPGAARAGRPAGCARSRRPRGEQRRGGASRPPRRALRRSAHGRPADLAHTYRRAAAVTG